MADHTIEEMRTQARRAARYFAEGLAQHHHTWLAVEIDGCLFVAARADVAETLGASIDAGLLGEGKVDRPVTAVLIALFHAPAADSQFPNGGKVHLHVLNDVTLGRRVRTAGQCLCSKKHGSNELTVQGQTDMCSECVEVAAQYGLPWSLT